MEKYDVYIKSYRDKKATVRLIMELYEMKFSDAMQLVEAEVAGIGLTDEDVEILVTKLEEIGTATFITESDVKEDGPKKDRPFSVPALIGFIISLVSMGLSLLCIFPGAYAAIGFACMMFPATLILSIIGFRKAAYGSGRKIFPLLALLFGIAAIFISIIFSVIGGFVFQNI